MMQWNILTLLMALYAAPSAIGIWHQSKRLADIIMVNILLCWIPVLGQILWVALLIIAIEE